MNPDDPEVGAGSAASTVTVVPIESIWNRAIGAAVGLILGLGFAAVILFGDPAIGTTVTSVGILAWIVACFTPGIRGDPVAYASVTVLPAALALAAIAKPSLAPALDGASVAWLLLWSISPGGLWGWWLENVLRRNPAGSPERKLIEAGARIRKLASEPWTESSWASFLRELEAMGDFLTPRTAPLISAWQSFATFADADETTIRRVLARLNEEQRHLWDQPGIRLLRGARARMSRPTRGTTLEYEYPRLEALLATANEKEQSLIRRGAARIALRENGLLTVVRDQLLSSDLGEPTSPETLADILLERAALHPGDDDDLDSGGRELRRKHTALASFHSALAPLDFPLDAADAVYEAAKALPDPRDVRGLTTMAESILGASRSAGAVEVPFIELRPPTSGADHHKAHNKLTTVRPGWRGVALLILIGLLAGLVAKTATELMWPLYEGQPNAGGIGNFLRMSLIALVLFATFVVRFGRRDWGELGTAVLIATVSVFLVNVATQPIYDVLTAISPGLWDEIYTGNTGVLPFAPLYGAATAVVLIVTSRVLGTTEEQPRPLLR